jgi:hypothetical protein
MFKALEFRRPVEPPIVVLSGKSTPMNTAVREFKFHSVQRSLQREEFERKQREREAEQ